MNKIVGMLNPGILQYQREMEAWKRQLDFVQADNVYLKTRIAEIASLDIDRQLLAEAERFNDRVFQKDELILLIRSDLASFEIMLSNVYGGNGLISEQLVQKETLLKKEMETLELQSRKLLAEFNSYITEKL